MENYSTSDSFSSDFNDNFLIDVKPKCKTFNTSDERRIFRENYERRRKTELCKNWELRGFCKFETQCSFAHGRHELRNKMHLHSNFKTKHCFQFLNQGICKYGIRCQFIHIIDQKEKKILSDSLMLRKLEIECQDENRVENVLLGKRTLARRRLPIFVALSQNLT